MATAVPLAVLIALLSLAGARTTTTADGWQLLALEGVVVRQVVVDGQDPNTLQVIVGAYTETQMVSSDRGQTWRTVAKDLRPFYARDPNRPQTYFRWTPIGTLSPGIQRSTDDGQTWSLVYPIAFAVGCAMAAPSSGPGVPSVVLAAACLEGVHGISFVRFLRSLDGGESWTQVQFPVVARTLRPWPSI